MKKSSFHALIGKAESMVKAQAERDALKASRIVGRIPLALLRERSAGRPRTMKSGTGIGR